MQGERRTRTKPFSSAAAAFLSRDLGEETDLWHYSLLMDPELFIERVRNHPKALFFREKWGAAQDLSELPTVSRADLIETPLSHRRYKEEKALVKIIHSPHGPFLSEWGLSDIGREAYGIPSARPMVYLSDPHDA